MREVKCARWNAHQELPWINAAPATGGQAGDLTQGSSSWTGSFEHRQHSAQEADCWPSCSRCCWRWSRCRATAPWRTIRSVAGSLPNGCRMTAIPVKAIQVTVTAPTMRPHPALPAPTPRARRDSPWRDRNARPAHRPRQCPFRSRLPPDAPQKPDRAYGGTSAMEDHAFHRTRTRSSGDTPC